MANTDELEIDRPDTFLRRERAVQRGGIVALTLFVAAGAAGAFGNGPLAQAVTTEGATEVRYERFGRTTAATSIEIRVATTAADGQPVRFRLERRFMERLDYLELRPPNALKGFDDTHAFFEVTASAGRGHAELHYKPHRAGVLRTTVTPDGGAAAHLSQVIYF